MEQTLQSTLWGEIKAVLVACIARAFSELRASEHLHLCGTFGLNISPAASITFSFCHSVPGAQRLCLDMLKERIVQGTHGFS